MLQQTQVSRVLQKYPLFLKRFPTLTKLAKSSRADVIRAWRGMGYNNRAVRLRQLAGTVSENFDGQIPASIDKLMSLPGIGRYTAHAVACFAFDHRVPVVDTNIQRVLGRLFNNRKENVWHIAARILPKKHTYEWNQALMEFGAVICTARAPRCGECPVRRECPSAFRAEIRTSLKNTNEPGRYGVPNRIYRGKVVEILRSMNGRKSISSSAVVRGLIPRFSKKDHRWFTKLLEGLRRDGLISMKKQASGYLLSLPNS